MVTYHPSEGHLPTQGWSPTRRECPKDLEFGTYTLLTKLTLGDNYNGWSPTINRMVPHPKMVTTNLRMVTHQKEVY